MSRVVVTVLALALGGEATPMAQHRAAQAAPQVPAATPVSPAPPAGGSRFTSRMTLRRERQEPPRPPDSREPNGRVFLPLLPFAWTLESPFGLGSPLVPEPLPPDAPKGGVQLDVQPWRARVFVDGEYVGHVDEFRGYYHHLEVVAGPHRIVIAEPGYQPLVLDLFVPAGRTTTHRATLNEAPAY